MDIITYALLLNKIKAAGGGGNLPIHICTSSEYNHVTLMPTIEDPDENTLYLAPSGSNIDMFVEWLYVDDHFEKFGGPVSALPSVTSEDDGDVLMVVNGSWAKSDLASASGVSF